MQSNFHDNIGSNFSTGLWKHLKDTDNIFGSFWMNTITSIMASLLDILSLEAFFLE